MTLPFLRTARRWCLPALFLSSLGLPSLAAATPQLQLTVDKTTAAVGETIAVTCAVANAPAFVCWGATVLLPASGLTITGQSTGTAAVFVPDSRGAPGASARFGGHTAAPTFVSAPGGNHVLATVTVLATAPGTYALKAPSYGPAQPYGGILLPKDSTAQVIPLPAADVTVTITGSAPANAAPTVNAGPDTSVTLPSTVPLGGAVGDDGLPGGSTLTSAWSLHSGPPSGIVTFSAPTSPTTTAGFSIAGTYVLRLTASDGALSSSDDVTVTVNPASTPNTAPVVNAGVDQTITLPATAALAGTASDDGKPTPAALAYTWSKVSGTGTVTFSAATALSSTATFSVAGTYVLRLTVSDGALSTSDDVQVVVHPVGTTTTATPVIGPTAGLTTATPTLSGTATPGATVRIRDGGTVIGTVTADGTGAWTWTASPPLTPGSHPLTVTAQASGQSESAPTAVITVTAPATGGGTPPPATGGSGGGGGGCGLGSGLGGLGLALTALLRLALLRPRRR